MLGNKVKVLRGKLDLSRKELAEDLNISYQTLSKYETNEREPNIDTLKKLADYFNVSIDELVNRNTDLDSLHPKTKNECAEMCIRDSRYADAGFDGIVHVKSFGCTPEVDAMAVLQNISADRGIPILYLSYDSQTGDAGIQTRLEAFYDMIDMKRRKQP